MTLGTKEPTTRPVKSMAGVQTKSDRTKLLAQDGESSLRRYHTPEDTSDNDQETQPQKDGSASFDWKLKCLKTAATLCAFVGMGLAVGSYPPAVVNFQLLMNTDIQALGFAIVPGALANCLGSFLGGAAVDRINAELFFGTAVLILAASCLLYPWAPNIYVFATLHALRFTSSSSLNAGGQAYILKLWHGSEKKDRLFQGLQAAWSVGSVAAPFIVAPFLVSIASVPPINQTSSTGPVDMNATTSVDNITSIIEPPDVERVRYAFMIIGSLIVLASPVFYTACAIQGPFCFLQKLEQTSEKQSTVKQAEDKRYKTIFLMLFFLAFFIYVPLEAQPGAYLPAMAVNSLAWEVRPAAMLTGVYWGCTCLGRFVTVFLSTKFSGGQIVFPALGLTAVSFLLLSVFAQYKLVVWIFTGVCGLTTSAIYGSVVLFASDYIVISGMSTSFFMAGTSFGSLTTYPFGGYLYKTYTYMWVVYLALLATITEILLLAGIKLFASFLPQKSAKSNEQIEDPDPSSGDSDMSAP